MEKAQSGDTVRVDYEGRLVDGSVFDSSQGHGPLEVKLGDSQVIPGFEEALTGMTVGETRDVTIAAGNAYGATDPALRFDVPKGNLPSNFEPSEGLRLQLREPGGQTLEVTIAAVGEETVTLDANHPLAGQDLVFTITLVEIL